MSFRQNTLPVVDCLTFRHNAPGQPSISYKVIRRFISSKEFESPFGLLLLANTLNDIIHSYRTPGLTHSGKKQRGKCDTYIDIETDVGHEHGRSLVSKPFDLLSEVGSGSPENTAFYDFPNKCATKRLNVDKETFFSSSDSLEGSSSPGSPMRRKKGRMKARGRRRKRNKKIKEEEKADKEEKKESDYDAESKELEKLLKMADISASGRAQASESEEEEEEENQAQKKVKKSTAKKKEEDVSLLNCLDGAECLAVDRNSELDVQESDTDFLSVMNNEMKTVFLQSSDGGGDSSDEDKGEGEGESGNGGGSGSGSGSGSESGNDKDKCKPEKKVASEKGEEQGNSKSEDGLRAFRFSEEKETSEKSTANREGAALSDENSGDSVEYVQHLRRKTEPGKNDSKSEATSDADSGSDIQQVFCRTQLPTLSPTKGRKNINKILRKDSLQVETKQALKMETERKKRVNERMKAFQELFPDSDSKLVLDFDPDTKEELLVVSSSLVEQLKPHQKEGVRFMWNCCFESLKRLEEDSGSGCVLAHCMGLGKTLQIITLVHTILTQNTGVQTVMIMCPLNTLRNWAHEFKIWQKDCEKKIKPVDLIPCKTKHSRVIKVRAWCQQGGVLLISYEMFRSMIKRDSQGDSAFVRGFLDPGPDLVVCDEGHMLKNNNSALSKCISRIKTLRRIILTGTPLQNNLIEYYCMVQFVKPNILGTKKEFLNRFVNPINNGQFEDSTQLDVRLMKRRAHVLHTMLDGFIQRCGYYVLRPFLPEKQEYVISIALTQTQENIYRLFIRQCNQESRGLLKDFHWMQKVWTHPRVMLMHSRRNGSENTVREQWARFVREGEYESIESSGKLVLLFSILKRCREIGDKVLVFSQSLYSLDLIEFFLRKANSYHCSGIEVEFADRWVLGQDYFRLDGSTSSDNRDAYCQGFNSVGDERARLFLISTRAGGLGINLVAANRVIVFDASWNPTHDVQSIFRVYRFGQKKLCYIYRFLAAATMEEKIYKRQVTKLSLAHRILDEHQIERHYTMGNLQELYRYDPIPQSEWRIPKIPKDNLFAEILANNRNIIVSYHEHDSLLENKEEEELTEEERRAAWEDYEKEKLTPEHPRLLLNGNSIPVLPPTQMSSTYWPNRDGFLGLQTHANPQSSALISQSGSDLCKIVEVRTLSGRGGGSRGVELNKILEFGETFGIKRGEGEDFEKYCQRVRRIFASVFPWRSSGNEVRSGANGVNGV